MRVAWWAFCAFLVAALSPAATPPSVAGAPRASGLVVADAQPAIAAATTSPSPADDDDGRAVDSDDDSDDDASLTNAVAVALPGQQRLGYRPDTHCRHTPPDEQELLRPPRLALD